MVFAFVISSLVKNALFTSAIFVLPHQDKAFYLIPQLSELNIQKALEIVPQRRELK